MTGKVRIENGGGGGGGLLRTISLELIHLKMWALKERRKQFRIFGVGEDPWYSEFWGVWVVKKYIYIYSSELVGGLWIGW